MELVQAYEEYCVDCYYEGKTPVSYWAWLGGRTVIPPKKTLDKSPLPCYNKGTKEERN